MEGTVEGYPFMSTAEVVAALGVSRQTVQQYLRTGHLVALAGHGRRNLFARNQVQELVRQRAELTEMRKELATQHAKTQAQRITKLRARLARLEGRARTA
jgi:excisionase family DNA binding protein